MEAVFKAIAENIAISLEAISVLVVAIGALEAAYRSLWPLLHGHVPHGVRRIAWLSLVRWLLLGLEFMLAADIVRTAISAGWEDIGKLGAIAMIRTFLNYFLERDLAEASRMEVA